METSLNSNSVDSIGSQTWTMLVSVTILLPARAGVSPSIERR